MNDKETLSRLYLELANVVPAECKSSRELAYERHIRNALEHLNMATPKQRNGPTYQAADELRVALGWGPSTVGKSFADENP